MGRAPGATDCQVDGTVVNALTGAPIPHARVTEQRPGDAGSITGSDGKWELAGVPCGVVQFMAYHPGFISGIYGSRGPVSDPHSEEGVLLEPGSVTHGLQIQLFPESLVVGNVLDEFGDGIIGAQVDLLQSEVREGSRKLMMAVSATTDSAGHYRIGGLRPGSYLACAKTERYTYPPGGGKPQAYSERCYPGESASGAASTLALQAGAALQVDFSLAPVTTVRIRGDVRGLPPSVWHPSPDTIGRPNLRLWRSADGDGRPLPISANSREGTFDFSGITPGNYVLRSVVYADGGAFFASKTIRVGESDLDGVTIQFEPGVSVSGVVRGETSSNSTVPPLVFTAVRVTLVRRQGIIWGDPQFEWEGNRGSFTFRSVERGTYVIKVEPPAPYFVKSIRLNNEEVRGKELDISRDTGPVQITLDDGGGGLEGVVIDQEGNPARGAIFLFGSEATPTIVQTDDAGKFTVRGLAPGSYRVSAFDKGGAVEYSDADWMQRNGGQGDPVTISPALATQVSVTRRSVLQP
jgi:hypothetical protein